MEENNTHETVNDAIQVSDDELKEVVEETLERMRTQSLMLGYRTACMTIMQLIAEWHKPNCSFREHERIFKKVEEFCGKALQQEKDQGDN